MSWIIASPQYVKEAPNSLPYYVFPITEAKEYAESPVKKANDIKISIMSAITPAILSTYLLDLYSAFLNTYQTRFAKPYTPAQLIRATQHTVIVEGDVDDELQWTLVPTQITVKGGAFNLVWNATGAPLKIELCELEEEQAVEVKADEVQAVEVEPVAELTDGFLRLTSDTQIDQRRGIEEARIRAKWAQYKAQRAIAKYVEKYGDFDEEILSDSEDGDESE
jgi:hypothetical protein